MNYLLKTAVFLLFVIINIPPIILDKCCCFDSEIVKIYENGKGLP